MVDWRLIDDLRSAYDRDAARRSARGLEWREALLAEWLAQVGPDAEILDLGAGTGQAAAFAMGRVRRVVALDVSPQNVEHCRMRGVNASVGDFTRLDFADASFDGAYAFNSFLHVPRAELEAVLVGVRRVLRPGGHFLMATWGGRNEEGRYEDDWCIPPRFFSFLSDVAFEALTFEGFDVVERRTLDNETEDGLHTQVLIARAK